MKIKRFLLAPILFILLAVFLAKYSTFFSNPARYANNVQNVLHGKIEKIDSYFEKLHNSDNIQSLQFIDDFDDEDIIILKYVDDSLVFWSSNSVPVYGFYPDSIYRPRIIKLFNTFYYVKKKFNKSEKYIGLIEIKSRYPYENSFLKSGFNEDFKVPKNARIRFQKGDGYEIIDNDGKYLFNLVVPEQTEISPAILAVATALFFLGIILLFVFFFRFIKSVPDANKRISAVFVCVGVLAVVRFIQVYWFGNIRIFFFFDPYIYAESVLVPSLGDLLINSLGILFISFCIYYFIDINKLVRKPILQVLVNHFVLLVFFVNAVYFSHSLIYNSNISFTPNEFDQLSINTILSLFANGLNFMAFGIILVWNIRIRSQYFGIKELLKIDLPFFLGAFLIVYFIGYHIDILSIIFFIFFYIIFFFLQKSKVTILSYSMLQLFILFFSIYSIGFLLVHTDKKEKAIRSSLAVNLASERDPIAEYLFEGLGLQISSDTAIIKMINSRSIDNLVFYDYLKKSYFRGYWKKYDLIIAFCGPNDKLLTGNWVYCYGYYNDLVEDNGFNLSGSKFYYLDKHNGRISYLGVLTFNKGNIENEITLFIELDSRLNRDLLGYPELLLDEKFHQKRVIDQYSYAKYHKNQLVAQSGKFEYSLNAAIFGQQMNDIEFAELGEYEHMLYKLESNNLIVISKPTVKFIDLLVIFSFLFLFYYSCLLITLVIKALIFKELRILNNFRSKIQFSTVSVLIISMILIAVCTVWLNLRNYRQNQRKNLDEKIHSVLIELNHKLALENEITDDWRSSSYDNLNQLLIRFSDIFFTDINLYNPKGYLIATSRAEIFQTGLQGPKMDPEAFHKLYNEKQVQYIHREKISDLSYISAYVPFENVNGKLLAYLNLPYFTKQNEIQTALTALIVTIINIYLILILFIIAISVLITDQITRPLDLIQLKFRDLKLGGRYERIDYKKDDEIGHLVDEYNKMVGELEKSVAIIARSERETAWREMAKQIAHEIKNPLTPMRLSVQQLQRSWQNRDENYSQYLERVTNLLIEQIDNLSSIASGFSNFAQMPVAHIELVDLVKIIQKTVELFEGSDNYSITFIPTIDKAEISADKEQMSRVFVNLIKNAVQSIPEGRHGEISLTIVSENENILISISDNGQGIHNDIRDRMFTPNFTTKTSGMGLGLAIVHNIINQVGGEISFETEYGTGTTFYLRIPTALNKV